MKNPLVKILPLTLLFGALASCGGGNNPKTATVTVVNGAGGGTFNIGSSVTVTATVPEHKSFKEWQSEDKFVSDANPYTFTLEKDITLTAIFDSIQCTVTVTNGTGSGTYNAGDDVTVTADVPEGCTFKEWQSEGKTISNSNPYTFKVEKDITLTAIFNVTKCTVTVINGSGSGTYELNSTVNLTPNNPSKFLYWYSDTDGKLLSLDADYTLTVKKDITITAVDDYGINNYVSTIEHDFSDNEPLKVLSFTDIQLHDGESTTTTIKVINDLVEKTKPDLITFLGDLLNDSDTHPSVNNYKTIVDCIDSKNIPWAPVLGNHDYEDYQTPYPSKKTTTSDDLINYYQSKNNCLAKRGPAGVSGKLNYIVNVVDKTSKEVKNAFYMLDSRLSGADDTVAKFYLDAVAYNGVNIPSAVYTHIALPQYGDAYEASQAAEYRDAVGAICRNPCDLASGSRKVFENIKSTAASDIVICGHDHENAYYSTYEDVKLAYSMKSSEGDKYKNIAELGGGLLKMNVDGSNDFEYVKVNDVAYTISNGGAESFNPDTLGYWRYSGNKFECDIEFNGDSGTIDLNFQGTNLLRYQLTLKDRLGAWNRLTKNATFYATNKTVDYGTLTLIENNKYHYSVDLDAIDLNNGSGEVACGDETLRLCYFHDCTIPNGIKISNIKYVPEEITEKDQVDLSSAIIEDIEDQFYVKDHYQKPKVNVSVDGTALNPISDYLAIYTNNIEVGTASVKIVPSGKGAHKYKGEQTKNFNIIINPDDDEYPGHENAMRFDSSCTLEDDKFIECNNWKNANKSLSFEVKKLNYGEKKESLVNRFALFGTNANSGVTDPTSKWNRLTNYYYFHFSEDNTTFTITNSEGSGGTTVATGVMMEHDNWFTVELPFASLAPNSDEHAYGNEKETIKLWYFDQFNRSFKLDHIALINTSK